MLNGNFTEHMGHHLSKKQFSCNECNMVRRNSHNLVTLLYPLTEDMITQTGEEPHSWIMCANKFRIW